MHMAIAAVVNALWDLAAKRAGKPLWQLLAEMSPEELVELVDFRYLTDALTPERGAGHPARRRARQAERIAHLRERGYPAYTTSPGWLGYDDDKLRRLCKEAVAEGFTPDQAQGRRRPRRRHAAAAHRPRGVGAGHPHRDRRQPALGRRRAPSRWVERPGGVRPALDRGADQPRRRPRPRRHRPRHRAHPGRHRRARPEPRDLQAAAPGRRDRPTSRSTRPASPASTRTSRSCCWPPSSACRSARTPAASACASWCSTCRCSTTSPCRGSMEDRVIEYVDHLHEHFVDPVVIGDGRYVAPSRARLQRGDARRSRSPTTRYPDGPVWRVSSDG